MRVIQTRNDIIRLIFNPKTDGLCLSDFLIVRDNEDNFLGQIVEIYDDKFNQEENVATIRLVFRILSDRQIVPYDNYTPSRECEIAKIKLEEIEKCLNIDKTTVPFGISTKNDKIININLNFFNNNPVVFADKLDEVNCAFENIAQKLKAHKKVVVIDYTGNINIQNAKRIKAKDDFKLPLDYYSLEYIWRKALNQISIEAQAELEDMFVELQKFVASTEDKYIPFPRFIKVIEQQYKATPAVELKLLLSRLKKYWAEDLFSRSKKEFQSISKSVQKEDVTIVDLSNLKLEWHREFLEFVVRQIKDYDAYLLLRLNENNSNPEIINNLYLKNPKLNIIPSISYGFVKLPQVMEFASNYILYKTLNPRRDFGFANFQVASLNSSSFLIFGKDTMDFMFVLKNYVYNEEDLNKEEEKKLYIDLNLELEEMTSVELAGGDFELKNIHIQGSKNTQRNSLSDEVSLDEVLPQKQISEEQNNADNIKDIEEINENVSKEGFQDIPLVKEEALEEPVKETTVKKETEKQEEDTDAEQNETTDNVSDEISANEPMDVPYTLEEVGASSTDAPDIIEENPAFNEADNKTIGSEDVVIDNSDDEVQSSNMAELIEASLKNDEEYMKELSKNEISSVDKKEAVAEIPLAEEDLDYFINPVDEEIETNESDILKTKENVQENIITTEMIEDAAANEELANELKEQVQTVDDAINVSDDIKKNSLKEESSDEKSNAIINEKTDEAPAVLSDETQENMQEHTSLHEIKAEADNILADEHDPKEIAAAIETMEAKEAKAQETAINKAEQKTVEESVQSSEEQKTKLKETPKETLADEVSKEPVIIVKEKPNLVIDDFTEEENETQMPSQNENEANTEENGEETLKELAQKSIDARFDEVIGETKVSKSIENNKVKITENVSIDLNSIKNTENAGSALPVFNNNEDTDNDINYNFEEGMRVSHEKYGAGSILKVVKYSNRCLLQIEFEDTGKRLLDPKIARIRPIE